MEAVENSPATCRPVAPAVTRRKDPQRSGVANGSELLPGVDQRSVWVRRCRELIADFLSDCGGEDNTSAAERNIIRRASVLIVELERLEVKFATAGEANPGDLDLYQRTAANMRRLLESVGIKRRARDVSTGALHEQLAWIDEDAA
jgi:hypothetical protein